MKRKIIIVFCLITISACLTPFFLNKYRVGNYEQRMLHASSFKTESWYFPNIIPQNATSVYFDYQSDWGSLHILRFQLPEKEALSLRSQIISEYSAEKISETARPEIITPELEELA